MLRHFWSRISKKKRCVLGTKLLWNTNRKPYPVYRIVLLSMTLIDPWPEFQGRDIAGHWISQKRHEIEAIVTIEHEWEFICSLSNGDFFNDLQRPLTRFSRSWHFWSRISSAQSYWQSCYRTLIRKPYLIMWNGTIFGDLDWPLNASRGLSAIAEFLVPTR